jgi:L-threonylcarbamoyladenylate synthase
MKLLLWSDIQSVNTINQEFLRHKIVVSSTDTVLGLLAPASQWGFEALKSIKRREQKPFIVFINSFDQLNHLVDPSALLYIPFLKKIWPAQVTFIFKAKAGIESWMCAAERTIAIRMPNHKGLQELISLSGPLFSTSANQAGMPNATTFDELDPIFDKYINLVVMEQKEGQNNEASTIVDLTMNSLRLIRQGEYCFDLLKRAFEDAK